MHPLDHLLAKFCADHDVKGRAQLAVLLHLTRRAWEKGMPMDPESLRGENGRVAGLCKRRIQYILQEHGYRPIEARQAVRVDNTRLDLALEYCACLNQLYASGSCAFHSLESACLSRFVAYRHAKFLFLKWGLPLGARITDLIEQARKLQRELPDLAAPELLLRHLVGASLWLSMRGEIRRGLYAASDPDQGADFLLRSAAIHIATTPSEALFRKCAAELEERLTPVLIMPADSRPEMLATAREFGLAEKMSLLDAEQYFATFLLERGRFAWETVRDELLALIGRYNEIIEEIAGEPLLLIGDNTY